MARNSLVSNIPAIPHILFLQIDREKNTFPKKNRANDGYSRAKYFLTAALDASNSL